MNQHICVYIFKTKYIKNYSNILFSIDCEKDDKKYSNGEKLVDSSDPCEVCYCQGWYLPTISSKNHSEIREYKIQSKLCILSFAYILYNID